MTGSVHIVFRMAGKKLRTRIVSDTKSGRSAVTCEYLAAIIRYLQYNNSWLENKHLALTIQKGDKSWRFGASINNGPRVFGTSKSWITAIDHCLRNLYWQYLKQRKRGDRDLS